GSVAPERVGAGRVTSHSAASRRSRLRETVARSIGLQLSNTLPATLRYQIVHRAADYQTLTADLVRTTREARALAPLRELESVNRFLVDHRPPDVHANACGDFQLMAREHFEDLRAYPELEAYSMNIDGLFGYIAAAYGIEEEALPMPIYHFEHEI